VISKSPIAVEIFVLLFVRNIYVSLLLMYCFTALPKPTYVALIGKLVDIKALKGRDGVLIKL
jgi:hypothetical protein